MTNERIQSLQGLRGIACLVIMAGHFSGLYPVVAHSFIFTMASWAMVSLFFVLSGFLTGYRYVRPKSPIAAFFAHPSRKIGQLYPLMVLTTIAIALMGYFYAGDGLLWVPSHVYVKGLICNLLFIQSWIHDSRIYFSFNGVNWFLSVYVFLVFVAGPACGLLSRLSRKGLWLTMVVLFLGLVCYHWAIGKADASGLVLDRGWWVRHFPPSRLFEFFIACSLGFLMRFPADWLRNSKMNWIGPLAILWMAVLLFVPEWKALGDGSVLRWIVPNVILVGWCMRGRGRLVSILESRTLQYAGALSMPIFMIHQVVARWSRMLVPPSTVWRNLGCWAICFLATVLLADGYRRFSNMCKRANQRK